MSWLKDAPAGSRKTTELLRSVNFPTLLDRILAKAMFGFAQYEYVERCNSDAATASVVYLDHEYSDGTVRTRNTYLTPMPPDYHLELISSMDDVRNELEMLGATRIGYDSSAGTKVSQTAIELISANIFFTKDYNAYSDLALMPTIAKDLEWYIFKDFLGIAHIVGLHDNKRGLCRILVAGKAWEAGIAGWHTQLSPVMLIEGVAAAPEFYQCARYTAADGVSVKTKRYELFARIMLHIEQYISAAADKIRVDDPTFYYDSSLTSAEDVQRIFRANGFKALMAQDGLDAEKLESWFLSRRSWFKKATNRDGPNRIQTPNVKTDRQSAEGAGIKAYERIAFSKPPLVLQLNPIGSLYVDSLLPYVFAQGGGLLARSLSALVPLNFISSTYNFVGVTYAPFGEAEKDPILTLGNRDNMTSGIWSEFTGAADHVVIEPPMYITHRTLKKRGFALPLFDKIRYKHNGQDVMATRTLIFDTCLNSDGFADLMVNNPLVVTFLDADTISQREILKVQRLRSMVILDDEVQYNNLAANPNASIPYREASITFKQVEALKVEAKCLWANGKQLNLPWRMDTLIWQGTSVSWE